MMMRIVSIDVGQKRTGVAVGDTFTRIVSPREVIEIESGLGGGGGGEGSGGGGGVKGGGAGRGAVRGPEIGERLMAKLAAIIEEEAPGRVVIGLPLNMDGTEGPAAKAMRGFAGRLAARLRAGVDVVLHDERLSSADADWAMAGSGLTHKQKKMRRDALAAAAILRGYLGTLETPGERAEESG